MRSLRLTSLTLVLALSFIFPQMPSVAQSSGIESSKTAIVLTEASPPVYPPLARQAAITGDVKILASIRPDGSVASAEAESGHPMLEPAALEHARNLHFECGGCEGSYTVTYHFVLSPAKPDPCCCSSEKRHVANSVDQEASPMSGNHEGPRQSNLEVVVVAEPACICPDICTSQGAIDEAVRRSRFRSAKCLYLWKCAHRHEVIYVQ